MKFIISPSKNKTKNILFDKTISQSKHNTQFFVQSPILVFCGL